MGHLARIHTLPLPTYLPRRHACMSVHPYSFFIALKKSSNKQPSGKKKKNIKKMKNSSRENLGNSFYAGRFWDNVYETNSN